uniref:RING-type domain-containing protein n=1 Tax=Cuerna arida TaxID=1464854 RepID=A0A1B6F327_9HEMI
MYYQLLDCFPEIDRNYLSDLCKTGYDIVGVTDIILETNNNYPKRAETSNEFSYRNSALDVKPDHLNVPSSGSVCVNNILVNNCTITSADSTNTTTQTKSIEQNDEDLKMNTQLEFLMQIFPKADPEFLKEKCTLNDKALRVFITHAMEKHDYPKIIDKTVTEPEDIGLYTTAFNLNNFLKIFPDPFVYFMDEKRICQYSSHAVEFMKRRYKYQSIKNIHKNYKDFGYNLPRTCEFLEYAKQSRSTKRTQVEIHMPKNVNLPFLQEMCFVEHKEEIKAHLDSIAESKRLAYEQAEARGELIECGCCYSSVVFEDCAACNEGDLFCKSCILKSTAIRIGDGCTTFPCLLDCGSHFSLHLLQNLLEARVFSKLLQRIQLDEVKAAEIEGLEICPFCEFATIPPPETNIFTCLNPDCLKESCRKCHKVSHIPQRCEEVENDDQARARKYIEDEMTKALVRECYKCKKSFIKSDGCNKMTCTCGAKMCYICRQPITDYKHFNGPGGSEKSKCPLYSTEKLLHEDAVKAVAEKALQDVAVNNPELKLVHDPSKILPSVPNNRTGLPAGVQELPVLLLANLQRIHNEPRPVRDEHVGPMRDVHVRPVPLNAMNQNMQMYRNVHDAGNLRHAHQVHVQHGQWIVLDNRPVVHLAANGAFPRGQIEPNPPHPQNQ